MLKKKWVRRTLVVAVYVVLAGFLAWAAFTIQWSALSQVSFNLGYLALALVFGMGYRYWQTFIWITVLRGLGAKGLKMNVELIYVYAKSWLGRYIPGTAPWILGKVFFASRHGVSKTKLAIGSLLEAAIQITVMLLSSSVMLFLDPRLSVPSVAYLKPIMLIVVVVCIIALMPPVFNRLMVLAFRILRRPPLDREHFATWKTIGIASAQYFIGTSVTGASLFCMAAAIYPQLGFNDLFFVIAAGNLSGALSMLVIFLPSGIGLRDGLQLELLRVIMPGAIAAAVVVVTRVWTLILDLLFFSISWVIIMATRRQRQALELAAPIDTDADEPSPLSMPTSSAASLSGSADS